MSLCNSDVVKPLEFIKEGNRETARDVFSYYIISCGETDRLERRCDLCLSLWDIEQDKCSMCNYDTKYFLIGEYFWNMIESDVDIYSFPFSLTKNSNKCMGNVPHWTYNCLICNMEKHEYRRCEKIILNI